MPRRSIVLTALAAAFVAAATFAQTVGFGFVWDDRALVLDDAEDRKFERPDGRDTAAAYTRFGSPGKHAGRQKSDDRREKARVARSSAPGPVYAPA